MYTPQAFEVTDVDTLKAFISAHSFATVISTLDGTPFASHLPLLLVEGEHPVGSLVGHVARANPHSEVFDGRTEILAIFHGPHGYISPTWYETPIAVPTWNYAVVHVYATATVIDDPSNLVDDLVTFYEGREPSPWPGTLPDDYRTKMLNAIVGFRLDITRVEGKFKLGQNRSRADQQSIVDHLQDRNAALAELTENQIRNG